MGPMNVPRFHPHGHVADGATGHIAPPMNFPSSCVRTAGDMRNPYSLVGNNMPEEVRQTLVCQHPLLLPSGFIRPLVS